MDGEKDLISIMVCYFGKEQSFFSEENKTPHQCIHSKFDIASKNGG